MRKINITETLKAINFVTSVGMEDEVKAMAALVKSGKKLNVQEVGIQFIVGCVGKMTDDKALNKLFDILSGPFEVDAETLKKMSTEDFMPLFVQFLDTIDEENLKGFFNSVSVSIARFK
jgi:CRISPR/Cas system endoribonuclease Cas6 (RAMP superfamily)